MSLCVRLTPEMLSTSMAVNTGRDVITFSEARKIADARAKAVSPDAMLLAWFDGKSGEASPRVECCRDDKPGWLVYAESRGGDIVIDINHQEYVFVYLA